MSDGVSGIFWVASYPSSGNTWMRVFLVNLLLGGDSPADINRLDLIRHAAGRSILEYYGDVETSELTPGEVQDLRPAVYRAVAVDAGAPVFLKIHDAYARTPSGLPLVPREQTRGVIYLVRNPLDVVASYASHFGHGIDETLCIMEDEEKVLGGEVDGIQHQVRQRLGSWSGHVRSWVDESELPVHVVRYEDMKRTPVETFTEVADFAELAHTPERLRRAIAFSEFSEVRRQEQAAGFIERSTRAQRFFRRGESGGWHGELTPEQVDRVIRAHGDVMRRFGYLDPRGGPSG